MNRLLLQTIWVAIAVGAAGGAFATDLKSPDRVQVGLRKLAGEYADMARKLAAGRYERLPHENQEFQEESGLLRAAIADEPADFKANVESTLERTLAASANVADVSATGERKEVESALKSLATLLKSLNELFPENVRVEPVE